MSNKLETCLSATDNRLQLFAASYLPSALNCATVGRSVRDWETQKHTRKYPAMGPELMATAQF